jgi:ribosomal protein L7Ae-like RNA K-turn-binding protein
MNITVDDYEIYKKLISFLEKDNVDYVTVSKNNEMSVSIPVSELSEEIRYIIKPNPIADMFRQSAS